MSDKKLFEDFGLDDLAEEHSDNRAGKIVLAVFLFAMWAALAWTTAEFFAAFGSQLGQRFGQLAPLFAAAFGALTIDVAYSAWLYAGKEQADTTAQRIAAIGTAVVLFLISLVVTGVYMMLTGDLREGVIDAQMTDTLKVAGIAILAASTVVNGIGLMLWAVLGHGWRKAAFYSQMRAVLYEEAASIDEQRAKLTAAARREWLKAQMPDAASQRGIQAGGQYMERAQLAATSRPAPAEQFNRIEIADESDRVVIGRDSELSVDEMNAAMDAAERAKMVESDAAMHEIVMSFISKLKQDGAGNFTNGRPGSNGHGN